MRTDDPADANPGITERFPTTPFDPRRRLAFLHVPKAAGISLRAAVSDAVGVGQSRFVVDRPFFGNFDAFDQISAANLALILFDDTDSDDGLGFVGGHISLSTLRGHYPAAQVFTVLREPVTRLLSNWTFLKFQSAAALSSWGEEWTRRNLLLLGSLEDFLAHPENLSVSDNLILRMLLRPHPLIPPNAPIRACDDETLLTEAVDRLRAMSFVDVVENPRLAANASAWLSRELILPHLNPTEIVRDEHKRTLNRDLTPAVFALLRARSRLDLRLWEMVAEERLGADGLEHLRSRSILGAIRRFRKLLDGDRRTG